MKTVCDTLLQQLLCDEAGSLELSAFIEDFHQKMGYSAVAHEVNPVYIARIASELDKRTIWPHVQTGWADEFAVDLLTALKRRYVC